MEFAFAFIAGIVIGMLVSAIAIVRMQVGTFLIDRSDHQKDICRLDINDLDDIAKKDFIILRVDSHADLSQK